MDNDKNRARLIDLASLTSLACPCKICQFRRIVRGVREPTLDERADAIIELREAGADESSDVNMQAVNELWNTLPASARHSAEQRANQRNRLRLAEPETTQTPQWAQLKTQLEAQHMNSINKTIVYGLVDLAEEIWKKAINE